MGTLFLSEFKRQASSFIQEKYKTARLVLTDVTPAELLTEEATNNDPSGLDAKTMTRISQASFDIDDYWRIVDVLQRRLYTVSWKEWRQSYKALVLLDFLLTHGPETIPEEFSCDIDVIKELGNFKHIDEQGFDWGTAMKKKSERILLLLEQGELLKEARSTALRVSKEIQGFGNLLVSRSNSSSSSRTSSFNSRSSYGSACYDLDDLHRNENHGEGSPDKSKAHCGNDQSGGVSHLWDNPIQENGLLIDHEEEEVGEEREDGPVEITSLSMKDSDKTNFRSFSNVGKVMKKKLDRQLSLGF